MQGYGVSMLVTESRMLLVSIFRTLQNNLPSVDISTVLLDVMAIADEVDSQLEQAVLGFMSRQSAKAATVQPTLSLSRMVRLRYAQAFAAAETQLGLPSKPRHKSPRPGEPLESRTRPSAPFRGHLQSVPATVKPVG